jgi:hypothetical protein
MTQQPTLATVRTLTADLLATPQSRQMLLLAPIQSLHPACCIFPAPQVTLMVKTIFTNVLAEYTTHLEVRGCQFGHHSRPQVPVSSMC